jgi:hypothetical protein
VINWLARVGIPLIALSLAFDTFGGSADGASLYMTLYNGVAAVRHHP